MRYSPAIQEVQALAAAEARLSGSPKVEPEHLLIAICRLADGHAAAAAWAGELSVLEGLFRAAKVRPADLMERLRDEMRRNGATDDRAPGPSNRCNDVLRAAEDYANEEGGTASLCLGYLLEPLIAKLGASPVFMAILADLGGELSGMREHLGQYASSIVVRPIDAAAVEHSTTTLSSPSSSESADLGGSTNPRSAGPSEVVVVPGRAVLDMLKRADEAMKREHWTEAAGHYEEALAAYSHASPAWNNLGVAYMRLRRSEEAKRCFERAIIIDAHNADAHANLGVLLARDLNQPDKAVGHLEEALRINPKHACRIYLESLRAIQTGQKQFTVRPPSGGQLPRATDVRLPVDKEALADALEAEGKLYDALAIYEEFLKTWVHSLQALNNAGILYNRLGQPKKASELLEKAVALDPTYVKAWNNLGTARGMLGDFVRAEEAFRTSLKHEPSNAVARRNLQALLAKRRFGDTGQVRLVPPVGMRTSGFTERSSPRGACGNRAIPHPGSSERQIGASPDELQHAADHQILPKALLRHAVVCLVLGAGDVIAGFALRQEGWEYGAVAGLGGSLALMGVLWNLLQRRAGLLAEGCLLLALAIGFCGLLAATRFSAGGGPDLPWGRISLLGLLAFVHLKAGIECIGRYRWFADMPTGRPSEEAVRQLEEIRRQILSTEAESCAETVEFRSRSGRWKGRLENHQAIFVNVNLHDVLFVKREELKLKQPSPNGSAIWLQAGKHWLSIRVAEPSATRLREWCLPANRESMEPSRSVSTG